MLSRKSLNGRYRAAWWFLCLAPLASGCARPSPPTMPDPLRVGVLPDQERGRLESRYAPLIRYLGETLHVRAELVIPQSYEELGERFHRGELDLAFFGGITFIEAERRDGASPLVTRLVDLHFTSVAIARRGLQGAFPDAFRNASFVFGPRASTSGHRMPRHYFSGMNLVPEAFFRSVAHLGSHDEVIRAIEEGRADVGVVNSEVLRRRIADGAADPSRFREVWESPAYADYVWATPPRLEGDVAARLRDAFLALDIRNPSHEKVLTSLGTRLYVPATRADFNEVRSVVTGRGEYARQ